MFVLRLQSGQLTDMSTVSPPTPSHETVQVVRRLIIKCCDISNQLRATALSRQWGLRVVEEYFDQARHQYCQSFVFDVAATRCRRVAATSKTND